MHTCMEQGSGARSQLDSTRPVEECGRNSDDFGVHNTCDWVIDQNLAERAKCGDRHALSQLFQRNYRHCLKVAFGILRNYDDAEDEVQNALSKAIERLEQYKGEGSFSSWLARIVANESYVRFRTERHVRFFHIDESVSPSTGAKLELVDQNVLPEDHVGDCEVVGIVRSEIRHMPPLLRNVLQLRDVQQLPMASVAAELRLTVPAAKSRLARARRELRSRLVKKNGKHGHWAMLHKPHPAPTVAVTNGD